MTPTKDQLIAAREALKKCKSAEDGCIAHGAILSPHMNVIESLIDSYINLPDWETKMDTLLKSTYQPWEYTKSNIE